MAKTTPLAGLSRENFDDALGKYVDFLKKTGGISLAELIEGAGFESPFNEGSLLKTAQTTVKIISEAEKKI